MPFQALVLYLSPDKTFLKKEIENFNQNNIDWVKIREVGELDYSKPFLRDTKHKKKEVA